jgi:hypothetical protein
LHGRIFNPSTVSIEKENSVRYLPIANNTFLLNLATSLLLSQRCTRQPQ